MQKRRRKTSKEERICPICSQGFNKAEHLVRHVRSHAKEKPFECTVCGRMYARQDTLLRHSRSHQEGPQHISDTMSDNGQDAQDNHLAQVVSFQDGMGPNHAVSSSNGPVAQMFDASIVEQSIQDRTQNICNAPVSLSGRVPVTTASSYLFGESSLIEMNNTSISTTADTSIQQNDLIPYWGPKDDLSVFSIDSFFDVNDINLDDLNLSFLNAAGEYPLQPVSIDVATNSGDLLNPGTIDTRSTRDPTAEVESTIQQSWHTYCDQVKSGHMTPDPRPNPSEMDDDYHRNLASNLQPRVQEGTLPSASFLNLCIQAYFANFQPILPIVHAPTFKPHARNGLLLLSICSIGSLFIGSSRAVSQGISMFERLNKANLSSWDLLMTASESSSYIAFQASVVAQTFGLLVGRPKDLMQIQLFHGTMVVWGRRLNMFRLQKPQISLRSLDDRSLEQSWKQWIGQEERRRTVLALRLLDAEIARMFHHDPAIRQPMSQLYNSSSRAAFPAPNAKVWREAMLKDEEYGNSVDTQASFTTVTPPDDTLDARFPPTLSEFSLYVFLERIGAIANEHLSLGAESGSAVQCEKLLLCWLERYRHTPAFLCQVPSLMMLWHSIFMSLNMDLDVLECASGRDGSTVMNEHLPSAKVWARSSQARKCVIHAVLLQRQFESMPLGSEPPVHAAASLYRCGIAWYCFTRCGTGKRPGAEVMTDIPELRPIGIDGNTILVEDIGSRMGRPDSALIRTVDLLQRISHWKVADRLASTLLALVEKESGLY